MNPIPFLLAITIDTEVHLSDLIVLGSGLVVAVKVFLSIRDSQKDMAIMVRDHGKMIEDHAERIDNVEAKIETHHEWLISKGINK